LMNPGALDKLKASPGFKAMKADPDMRGFFEALESGGPAAVLPTLSDPKVMAKLEALIGSLETD